MANVTLEMLDGFSLVWALMSRHSKSAFSHMTELFELGKINSPNGMRLKFFTLLTFIALVILKKISLIDGFSLERVLM